MTPRELLMAAYKRQETLIDYMPWWANKKAKLIIRDWLKEAALSEEVETWPACGDEVLESIPVIRMAREILGTVHGSEL